jgi:hypothetical protein
MADYNGWSSYETWAVKLWMDNDQWSYTENRERAREAFDLAPEPRIWLADHLKDEYEEAMPEVDGVWADLLGAAFGNVDWFEIADSLLTEAAEEANA